MATPEQRLAASEVRGYSKAFLAQACSCGCMRVDHASRVGECSTDDCACSAFTMGGAAVTTAGSSNPRDTYILGTVGPAAAPAPVTPPELPAPQASAVPESNSKGPDLVQRPGSGTRCPFCLADDFESVPSLKCLTCKAWQHAACVQAHGKCAACNAEWPA